MMRRFVYIFLLTGLISCIASRTWAQNSSVDFSITDRGNGKLQINWNNPYENCIQFSVQKSFDSLKYFQTIFSAQSPALPKNGFVYNSGNPEVKIYFRIFYVLQAGDYFFTKSKSFSAIKIRSNETEPSTIIASSEPEEIRIEDIPFLSRKRRVNSDIITANEQNLKTSTVNTTIAPVERRFINVYQRRKDTLLQILTYADYKKFKDSISSKTKDTLYAINKYDVILMPFVPKYVWKPSALIFTNHNGYISIHIAQAKQHHYKILFLEEDGSLLFEIVHLKEPELVLDKSNFIHGGWFHFEIYEDGKLLEKNKVFLDKEF
jgi:hypothetical protein